MRAVHNAIHDYTEKDKAVKNWHDLKGASQMTIFQRQEQRRKQYEHMLFKKAVWDFAKYAVPVGVLITVLYAYSDMFNIIFKK